MYVVLSTDSKPEVNVSPKIQIELSTLTLAFLAPMVPYRRILSCWLTSGSRARASIDRTYTTRCYRLHLHVVTSVTLITSSSMDLLHV
jgi:hypothetical protein